MSAFQIFTPLEIASLRLGGAILHACLEHVSALVAPGVTTDELDLAAEKFIRSHDGAKPAFKGYHGFPATLCTSVNDECVHGIPGKRILRDGDIVSLDCGVLYDNLYTDACVTVGVGHLPPQATALLRVTKEALMNAIHVVRAGVRIGDISAAVEKTVTTEGCIPIKPLTGHGVGDSLHQFPDVPNFTRSDPGPRIPEHTVLAIEPIISVGKKDGVKEGQDGWTLKTEDCALSAHFEHTVLVTDGGCEVLT